MASGKYVDYGAWADGSALCMDNRLAEWDRYIEEIAGFMGVTPLRHSIRYSWVPMGAAGGERWPCSTRAGGCAHFNGEGYQAHVFTSEIEILHELVHAVETPMRGRSHPVFGEGMAEYLSDTLTTEHLLPGFSAAFQEMLAADSSELSYPMSMHFVGSLIERHGIEKYYEYRSLLVDGDDFARFSDAYQAVYRADLSEALSEMELVAVHGLWQPWGCESPSAPLSWTTDEMLTATLSGECGDGAFFGGGFVEGRPGFSKVFTIDIAMPGYYDLQVKNAMSGEHTVQLVSCPGAEFGAIHASSTTVSPGGILYAGRHSLRVDFPQSQEARGEVEIGLEFLGPIFPP